MPTTTISKKFSFDFYLPIIDPTTALGQHQMPMAAFGENFLISHNGKNTHRLGSSRPPHRRFCGNWG